MKRIITTLVLCSMLFALVACGNAISPADRPTEYEPTSSPELLITQTPAAETTAPTPEETNSPTDAPTSTEPGMETTQPTEPVEHINTELVVYFSWSGNTEAVATEIQRQTGADSFAIVPVEPYTDDYDALLDIAQAEQRSDARPEISGSVEGWDDYEIIYLGFPNWWGDMPMILYSFLDAYDFSGKTIVPFCTSGGSGFSNTIRTITSMEPNATILEGLHIRSSAADAPQSAVTEWLSRLDLLN